MKLFDKENNKGKTVRKENSSATRIYIPEKSGKNPKNRDGKEIKVIIKWTLF